MKLSLAMIVKNEEKYLARCLESVSCYVDEIVIADTGSADKTKEIALSFGASVYDFEWCGDFSKARNFIIEKAKNDYVLIMDADNVLLEFDKNKVEKLMTGKNAVGLAYIINRYTENGDKTVHKSLSAAIIPKKARYERPIHEHVDPSLQRIVLPISILHDGYENRDKAKFKRNIDIMEKVLKEKDDPQLLYKLAQEYRGLEDYNKAGGLFEKAYKTIEKGASFYNDIVTEYLQNLIVLKAFEKALKLISSEESYFSNCAGFFFVCGLFYTDLVLSDPKKYITYFNKIEESYQKCISIGENNLGVVGMGSFLPMHNLAAFYEVLGNFEKAKLYYKKAKDLGYSRSAERLNVLINKLKER